MSAPTPGAGVELQRTLRASVRERVRAFRASRPARRAALRERRAAIAVARADARARIDAHPEVQRARWQRRRRRAIAAALLLLLLALLSKCECKQPEPPPVPPGTPKPVEVVTTPPKKPEPPKAKPKKRGPTDAKVAAMPRADFNVDNRAPPPWLEQLRLEVAARAPRLAKCFAGAEVPGALRWTASVNPGTGDVADSILEGNTPEVVINTRQRDCLTGVLHAPPFKLTPTGTGDALTTRVSLVVEF